MPVWSVLAQGVVMEAELIDLQSCVGGRQLWLYCFHYREVGLQVLEGDSIKWRLDI